MNTLYSIQLQYYYSDLTAVVKLKGGKTTMVVLSKELRELFEKEMEASLKEKK